MTSTEHRVQADDAELHVVEVGSADAPPLVLLHGGLVTSSPIWASTSLAYASFVTELATRFRVIMPDERGTGRSRHLGGAMSASLLADDVACLIETLGLEEPAIAGFSSGGLTATIFAIRHPGVARAIVNDAGYDSLNPRADSFVMLRQMLGGAPDAATADPDAAEAFFQSQPDLAPVFALMKADQDAGGGPGHWRTYLRTAFDLITRWPGYTFDDLAAIDAPTLIMVGDRDHFCSVDEAAVSYHKLRHGQLAVLRATGHAITPAKIAILSEFAAGR